MSKPLLTDDIIERARRGEIDFHQKRGLDDTIIFDSSDLLQSQFEASDEDFFMEDDELEDSFIKSRRIEQAKRADYKSKLNKVLLLVIVLLIILAIAVLKF